jgi:hypothetical protein
VNNEESSSKALELIELFSIRKFLDDEEVITPPRRSEY